MSEGAATPAKTPGLGKNAALECLEGPVHVERYTWEEVQKLPDAHPLKVMGLMHPNAAPKQGKEHKVIFLNDPTKHGAEGIMQFGAFDSPDVLVSNGFGSCVFGVSLADGRASLVHMLSTKQAQIGRKAYRAEWKRMIARMVPAGKKASFFVGGGMDQQGRFSSLNAVEDTLSEESREVQLFDVSGQTVRGQETTTVVAMPKERCIMVIRSAKAAEDDRAIDDIMIRPKIDPAAFKGLLG